MEDNERGRQVGKKTRKRILVKPGLKQDELYEKEESEDKVENENCHQQIDLLQELLNSREDHRKFPVGRGSKILKNNYNWFKWTQFFQAYTNYILECEEEAVREEIGKTLARVLKPCQG